MRNAFADEVLKLAEMDPRIVLLSGDIGNRLFDKFKTRFPKRFYNCGVAEANMAGVAAGLAMCGLRPITYTITPFNTTRCLEQIRDDIAYHNLPVLIVGTGAGLSYASLGCTHHSCEDLSFLRAIPNMSVLAPGDAMELRGLLQLSFQTPKPIYMRIGKAGEPVVHSDLPALEIGKGFVLKQGKDLALISTGNMLPTAIEVEKSLQMDGIEAELISMHTVKPLDTTLLADLNRRFPLIVSMEEHSLIGGLGAALAEWLVDQPTRSASLLRLGTQDLFPHPIGSQKYLRERFGLDPNTIKNAIIKKLKETSDAYTSSYSR